MENPKEFAKKKLKSVLCIFCRKKTHKKLLENFQEIKEEAN